MAKSATVKCARNRIRKSPCPRRERVGICPFDLAQLVGSVGVQEMLGETNCEMN